MFLMLSNFFSSHVNQCLSICKLVKISVLFCRNLSSCWVQAKFIVDELNSRPYLYLIPWDCRNAPRRFTIQRENHWCDWCGKNKDSNFFYFRRYKIMALKLFIYCFVLCAAFARVASYSRTCSLWKYIFRLSHGGAVLTKLW